MLEKLRDHFLRIDPRSLGAFRVAFGLVLLGDLFARWAYLRDFYSNEGVLPNHNHLFNLRESGKVWSFLHAFSSPGEGHFAFGLVLFVYLGFLFGWHTRIFQALALVALVSLTSRNLLVEYAGNHLAIALLAFTLLLPLGSRFSIDSLRASLALRPERDDTALNRHGPPDAETIAGTRRFGWSPASVAALAVLVQVALAVGVTAFRQSGEMWRDGSALHYALHVERWVSGLGVVVRESAPPGVLRGLSHAIRGAGFAVPVLLVLPAAFKLTRSLAATALALQGLVLGLLFSFGLYGFSLVAAAALLLPPGVWDAYQGAFRARRARTVIYDADCGVCLALARLLARFDLRRQLAFQQNDRLEELAFRKPDGALGHADLPQAVTPELVNETIVVADASGRTWTRGRAVVEILRALPFGWLALPLALPGPVHLLGLAYDFVARRRHRLSDALGMGVCGVEDHGTETGSSDEDLDATPSPAQRVGRVATGSFREAVAVVLLGAALLQTARENELPVSASVPQGNTLAAVAAWPRMMARWDLLAPQPPREDGVLVIDAQTRDNSAIDPLTGRAPDFDLAAMRGTRKGQLWADFSYRVQQKEFSSYEKAFREYLAKGGPLRVAEGPSPVVGLDAYWVTDESPPPGGPRPQAEPAKRKLFSHSRGGLFDRTRLPIPRSDARRP